MKRQFHGEKEEVVGEHVYVRDLLSIKSCRYFFCFAIPSKLDQHMNHVQHKYECTHVMPRNQ